MLFLGLLLTGFFFSVGTDPEAGYYTICMLHALHHSHKTLHCSHKMLHFLHETILAIISYEMVYMIWNTLKGFHSLYYFTVYCGPDVIWWYFIVTIPVHIELTIYSQIVNNACMFTYSFKTNILIYQSPDQPMWSLALVIFFVNFRFIFFL